MVSYQVLWSRQRPAYRFTNHEIQIVNRIQKLYRPKSMKVSVIFRPYCTVSAGFTALLDTKLCGRAQTLTSRSFLFHFPLFSDGNYCGNVGIPITTPDIQWTVWKKWREATKYRQAKQLLQPAWLSMICGSPELIQEYSQACWLVMLI